MAVTHGVTGRIVAGNTLTVDQKWYFSILMMTDIHGGSQRISVLYAASDGIELSIFIEIMDAFVNQDPDGDGQKNTYGVTAPNLQQSVFYSAYGFHNGVNEVNGEAEQYYVMDEFKEYLKGFAEIYKNGLIDPEIIEDNRKLSWDKVNTGKAGYWITSTNSLNSWASDRPPLTLLSADPEATILLTPGIKPDGGEVQTVTNSSPAYGYFYVNANVDDEKLARILQVEGVETIYVKPVEKLQNVRKEYDSEKDLLLADIDEDTTVVRLEAGSFIVLFPQDAHAPGCYADSNGNVRKIVGKVRILPEE